MSTRRAKRRKPATVETKKSPTRPPPPAPAIPAQPKQRRKSPRRKKPTFAELKALQAEHIEELQVKVRAIARLTQEKASLQRQADIWCDTAQRQSHMLSDLRHVIVDQAREMTTLRDQLKTRSVQNQERAVD